MPFTQLKLSSALTKGIKELGFVRPTPIQAEAIPPAMQEAADERQVLAEAAERAQIAEWARTNGLTGLSPASVGQ